MLVAFALTAAGVHLLGGTTWAVALLFGALIAATDPVSVVAVFRRLGVSERLTTMVDAESLFNDGTAAVVFAIVAAGSSTAATSPPAGRRQFLWMACGGLAVGLAVGYAASSIHRRSTTTSSRSRSRPSSPTGRSCSASSSACRAWWRASPRRSWSATSAAPHHGPGHPGDHQHRVGVRRVRRQLADLPAHRAEHGPGRDPRTTSASVLIAFAVVLVARAVTMYGYGLPRALFRRGLPLSWQHVLVWGGLRGTIALALVLSVPADAGGRSDLVTSRSAWCCCPCSCRGSPSRCWRAGWGSRARRSTAGEREREVLLDGFVRAHEELDRLEDAGVVGRVRRRDLEQVLDAGESSVLEGLPPLADEPEDGRDEELVERIGELVAQRRSLDALRHGGAVTDAPPPRSPRTSTSASRSSRRGWGPPGRRRARGRRSRPRAPALARAGRSALPGPRVRHRPNTALMRNGARIVVASTMPRMAA